MDGVSLTEMKGGGGGGGNTNWKSLADVKTEHLGHGDKVRTQHTPTPIDVFTSTHASNIPDTTAADIVIQR